MSAITFDGLAFVKTIESVGFPREQAEGIAKAVATLRVQENGFASREAVLQHDKEFALIQREIAENKTTMATKSDIADVKSEIADVKSEMRALQAATKADMDILKRDLTISMGTMMAAAVGLIVMLMKVL